MWEDMRVQHFVEESLHACTLINVSIVGSVEENSGLHFSCKDPTEILAEDY